MTEARRIDRFNKVLVLALGFLVISAGIVSAQKYNTSGGWFSSDDRRATSTTDHLGLGVTGDAAANDRFQLRADGRMQWGGGSAVPDVTLSRSAASTLLLATGDTFQASTFGFDNGETLSVSADDVYDFARNDAGIVTFTCSDDDATAGCTYDAGGISPIIIGSADVTDVTINSNTGITFADGGDSINNTVDDTFDFTRDDAGVVTIIASDDSSPVGGLTIDVTGAAPMVYGSGDVTGHTFTSDGVGGTVVLDGSVLGQIPVVTLASGALTANTIHLATAGGADYDIPNTFCDAAADLGNWITVILEDASVVVSITVDDVNNQIFFPGLAGIGADNELDSVSTASNESAHITLVCLAVDQIYTTAASVVSGGAIAWADGGAAD